MNVKRYYQYLESFLVPLDLVLFDFVLLDLVPLDLVLLDPVPLDLVLLDLDDHLASVSA